MAQSIDVLHVIHATIQRGGGSMRSGPPPLKNHKNIGFLSNTGPDHLNNHKATMPAFNVGPSLARQQNAIEMLLVIFGSPN